MAQKSSISKCELLIWQLKCVEVCLTFGCPALKQDT